MLTPAQEDAFRRDGQVTVPDLLSDGAIDRALADLDEWDAEVRATLTGEERKWYLEDPSDPASPFRKLDDPVFHRAAFRDLAMTPALVGAVVGISNQAVAQSLATLTILSASPSRTVECHE